MDAVTLNYIRSRAYAYEPVTAYDAETQKPRIVIAAIHVDLGRPQPPGWPAQVALGFREYLARRLPQIANATRPSVRRLAAAAAVADDAADTNMADIEEID